MANFPLRSGSTGPEVRNVQLVLNGLSYLQGRREQLVKDGRFGGATARLLQTLTGRNYVSSSDYALALRLGGTMVERIKQMRRTGTSAEMQMRQFLDYNEKIFYNLLDIYRIYKADPNRNGANRKYYVYAWAMAVNFNKRMAAFNTPAARAKGFGRRGYRPEYSDVIKELGIAGVGSAAENWKMAKPLVAFLFLGVFGPSIVESLSSGAGDSKTDWKQSEKVKQILRTLDPKDREAVEAEVEAQLETAYGAGHDAGKPGFLEGLFGGAKNMVLGGALLLGVMAFTGKGGGRG